MAATDREDYYAVLGVPRAATATDLRRAYRKLALQHHPDLAGAHQTQLFQLIVEAYRVLSHPDERLAYDAQLRQSARFAAEPHIPRTARVVVETRPAAVDLDDLLPRVSGPLDALLAADIARRCPDGVIELVLNRTEADLGGTAAIDASLNVPCPTCGGLAERHKVWCTRCQFEGTVIDEVTVCVQIPPLVRAGTTFSIPLDRFERVPPLRVRIRL